MVRFARTALILIATAVSLAAVPALAQFGWIFREEPPRPPANLPGERAAPERQPRVPAPEFPARRIPPEDVRSPSGLSPEGGMRGRAIESRPLAPPTGGIVAPEDATRAREAQPSPQAPEPFPPPSADVLEPPPQRIVNPTAIFAGLDKITGRITSFEVAIDETVQFGALQVTPRACYSRPPTETQRTNAFLYVDEVTLQGEIRRIFSGWMFAASPGLNAVEHPIYDIWLTDCKGGKQEIAERPTRSEPAEQPAALRSRRR